LQDGTRFRALTILDVYTRESVAIEAGQSLKGCPHDKYQNGKFKAYYSWSRGPGRKMIRRFENIGFEVITYTGYFGHNYYLKIPFLHHLEMRKAEALVKYPISMLCTYSTLVLRKPN
jgi:hypothetical protein